MMRVFFSLLCASVSLNSAEQLGFDFIVFLKAHDVYGKLHGKGWDLRL
jgi:hypothetical protein